MHHWLTDDLVFLRWYQLYQVWLVGGDGVALSCCVTILFLRHTLFWWEDGSSLKKLFGQFLVSLSSCQVEMKFTRKNKWGDLFWKELKKKEEKKCNRSGIFYLNKQRHDIMAGQGRRSLPQQIGIRVLIALTSRTCLSFISLCKNKKTRKTKNIKEKEEKKKRILDLFVLPTLAWSRKVSFWDLRWWKQLFRILFLCWSHWKWSRGRKMIGHPTTMALNRHTYLFFMIFLLIFGMKVSFLGSYRPQMTFGGSRLIKKVVRDKSYTG